MTRQLLIPAAGQGVRLGCPGPKALTEVGGRPLLVRTLERFAPFALVDGAVVVIPEGHREDFEKVLAATFPDHSFTLIPGGTERQASVANGLTSIDSATEIVVIHDAARPFVSGDSIQASIEAAEECGAATVAIPCVDTILDVGEDCWLSDTPDRRKLWSCQTPQTFRVPVIRRAHKLAQTVKYRGTDDASLVQRMGAPVKIVMGTPLNIKITTSTDLAMAHCIAQQGLV